MTGNTEGPSNLPHKKLHSKANVDVVYIVLYSTGICNRLSGAGGKVYLKPIIY